MLALLLQVLTLRNNDYPLESKISTLLGDGEQCSYECKVAVDFA